MKWSGRTSSCTKATPKKIRAKRKLKKKNKMHKLLDKMYKFVRWYVRRCYGTEQGTIAKKWHQDTLAVNKIVGEISKWNIY